MIWIKRSMVAAVVILVAASVASGQTPTDTPTQTPTNTPTVTNTPTSTFTSTPTANVCAVSCASGACGTPVASGASAEGNNLKTIAINVAGTGATADVQCRACPNCPWDSILSASVSANTNVDFSTHCNALRCIVDACSGGTCTMDARFGSRY